jgi:hypothetical protein
MNAKSCPQHPTCVSSDSGLPECRCWCAECREYMREVRRAPKPEARWEVVKP